MAVQRTLQQVLALRCNVEGAPQHESQARTCRVKQGSQQLPGGAAGYTLGRTPFVHTTALRLVCQKHVHHLLPRHCATRPRYRTSEGILLSLITF